MIADVSSLWARSAITAAPERRTGGIRPVTSLWDRFAGMRRCSIALNKNVIPLDDEAFATVGNGKIYSTLSIGSTHDEPAAWSWYRDAVWEIPCVRHGWRAPGDPALAKNWL